MGNNLVPIVKDEENEGPIPTQWRPIFSSIVDSFLKKDYRLSKKLPGVSEVSDEIAIQIEEYIEDYGEELVKLHDDTWKSSVCIWMGNHWDALIDLWTEGEGRSDLVLRVQVKEADTDYLVSIDMVYVP